MRLRTIEVQRITVVKFGMNTGDGDGTRCFELVIGGYSNLLSVGILSVIFQLAFSCARI